MNQKIELTNQPTGTESIEVEFNVATDAAILLRFTHPDGGNYDVLLNPAQASNLGRFLKLAAIALSV
jgi:hypothetical protein